MCWCFTAFKLGIIEGFELVFFYRCLLCKVTLFETVPELNHEAKSLTYIFAVIFKDKYFIIFFVFNGDDTRSNISCLDEDFTN